LACYKNWFLLFPSLVIVLLTSAQNKAVKRERLLMNFSWRFAFGHPFDASKDFGQATSYFSYLKKENGKIR
jgi:beta-galactosidase